MAIRGLEGNQNAQPRVFAHDALDLQESGYVLGTAIPNTETIGVCLYFGVANDITVKMDGGLIVVFNVLHVESFFPVLVTSSN